MLMTKKRKRLVWVLFLSLSLLIFFFSNAVEVPNTTSEASCIGDFDEFALPVSARIEFMPETILPMVPWELEAQISNSGEVEITRQTSTGTEVWLRTFRSGPDFSEFTREFLIYNVNSNQIDYISAELGSEGIWVDRLLVDNNGQIWGQIAWDPSHEHTTQNVPRIARFDEVTNRFELLETGPLIKVEQGSNRLPATYFTRMLFDENGTLWVFVDSDGIYSFDPATEELILHDGGNDIQFLDVVNSHNNTFVIQINESYQQGLQSGELLEYFPQSEQIVPIEVPDEQSPGAFSIMFDSSGRLWYGSVGWRDIDGNWHLLHNDPEAYFTNVSTSLAFLSATPNLLLESSNGYLWFAKTREIDNGVAWYDPKTRKGCWFTNVATQVVEDPEGNIWLSIGGALYRLSIK